MLAGLAQHPTQSLLSQGNRFNLVFILFISSVTQQLFLYFLIYVSGFTDSQEHGGELDVSEDRSNVIKNVSLLCLNSGLVLQ